LPEYQNKGVGKLLLYHAIKALNAPIRLKCLKKNTRALKFYEINGWKFNEAGKDVLGEYVLLEFSNELRY
jgi:GNAT superfamily N-acetyltransferase